MQKIYDADNIIDAYLVKGLLEQQSIRCFVNGEYLQGAMGELPVSGLVTIWVCEDEVDNAQDVLNKELADFKAAGETLLDETDDTEKLTLIWAAKPSPT